MKRRRTRRVKRRVSRRSKSRKTKRPIGYVKGKGGYALVYGSKKKPKLGKKFKTKTALAKYVSKRFRRR